MNGKSDLLVEKKSNPESTESRIRDVIRSLREVEKVLEKINGERKESASSLLKKTEIKRDQTVVGDCI